MNEEPKYTDWSDVLDERQIRLVRNCRLYAANDPAGVTGHNLMIIVALLADELDKWRRQGE